MSKHPEPDGFVEDSAIPPNWENLPAQGVWGRLEKAGQVYKTVPIDIKTVKQAATQMYEAAQVDSLTVVPKTAGAIALAVDSHLFDAIKIYVVTLRGKRGLGVIGEIVGVDQTTYLEVAREGAWGYDAIEHEALNRSLHASWDKTKRNISEWVVYHWTIIVGAVVSLVWIAGVIAGFLVPGWSLLGLLLLAPGFLIPLLTWITIADEWW